jgi:hypothetical protein
MRKEKGAPIAVRDTREPEHQLVAELREAMARKDIVTMGRMLELLGSIKAELVMGGPVLDRSAAVKSDPNAGNAAAGNAAPVTQAPPVRSLAARLARSGRAA